jgi:hypothetical protein
MTTSDEVPLLSNLYWHAPYEQEARAAFGLQPSVYGLS